MTNGSLAAEQSSGMSSVCRVLGAICKVAVLNLYLDFANMPSEQVCENTVVHAYWPHLQTYLNLLRTPTSHTNAVGAMMAPSGPWREPKESPRVLPTTSPCRACWTNKGYCGLKAFLPCPASWTQCFISASLAHPPPAALNNRLEWNYILHYSADIKDSVFQLYQPRYAFTSGSLSPYSSSA